MRKTSIKLTVGILLISMLILVGSTALGIANDTRNTTTGNTTTTGIATNQSNTTTKVQTPSPTEVQTPKPTEVQTPKPTEVQTPNPTKVQTPKPTVISVPTKKSPGFGSIFAMIGIISAIYIFGIKRR